MPISAKQVPVWLLPLLLGGCLSPAYQADLQAMSDRQRAAAWDAFEAERYDDALDGVRQAMHSARWLPATSVQVVEAYDDAALYFYMREAYRESARHQAIAVLLAIENPGLRPMLPTYVQRLGWAWAKYRPGSDFAIIEANPALLLDDPALALVADARIRQHFYRPVPGPWKELPVPLVRRR